MSSVDCEDWNPKNQECEETFDVAASVVLLGVAYLVVGKEESGGNDETKCVCVDASPTWRPLRWVFFIWADEL